MVNTEKVSYHTMSYQVEPHHTEPYPYHHYHIAPTARSDLTLAGSYHVISYHAIYQVEPYHTEPYPYHHYYITPTTRSDLTLAESQSPHLTVSRRGQDKRGSSQKCRNSHNQLSRENVGAKYGKLWQHMATCARLKQTIANM